MPDNADNRFNNLISRKDVLRMAAKTDEPSALEDFARSLSYSMVQGPVDGASQLADRLFGSNIQRALHVIDAPKPADFGSERWFAQQIGGLGAAVPVMLLHKGVKAMGFGNPELASVQIRNMAMTGGLYGSLLTSTAPDTTSFWTDRLISGTATAATFGTMSATSLALERSSVATNKVLSGVLGGIPAGIVHADSVSLLNGRGLATQKERAESIFTFSALGGMMGAADTYVPKFSRARQNTEQPLLEEKNSPVLQEKNQPALQEKNQPVLQEKNQPVLEEKNRPVAEDKKLPTDAPQKAAEEPVSVGQQTEPQRAKPQAEKTILDDGTKIIKKPDGTTVTIKTNGDTIIEADGVKTTRRASDGRVFVEKANGETFDYRPKSAIPPEEKPMNVASMSVEPIAKRMSNFAHEPFTLNGETFASVEAFYVALRIKDPIRRAEVMQMHGAEARAAGREFRSVTQGTYQGQTFEFGSPEHHAIVKEAIRAKLEQHPDLAAEFAATHPRPIIHNTGRRENPNTKYHSSVFTRHLMELRQELVDKKPAEQPQRADQPNIGDAATQAHAKSVSRLLRGIKDPTVSDNHNLKVYENAFRDFDRKATEVIGAGSDAVALRLEDGNVLKIARWPLTPEMGTRPFDLPVLERGTANAGGVPVGYYIQPFAEAGTPATVSQMFQILSKDGYHFRDPKPSNVGTYKGEPKLIDPFAAEKL